jgi:hypothetical protein
MNNDQRKKGPAEARCEVATARLRQAIRRATSDNAV